MYGKNQKAKQNKQRQQKGIISINCLGFFLSFFLLMHWTNPKKKKMLWDKHLFIWNMAEPLTGSAACACPYVPEVYIWASTAQIAEKVAQGGACSKPGCSLLTPYWGAEATLTRLYLTQQNKNYIGGWMST